MRKLRNDLLNGMSAEAGPFAESRSVLQNFLLLYEIPIHSIAATGMKDDVYDITIVCRSE